MSEKVRSTNRSKKTRASIEPVNTTVVADEGLGAVTPPVLTWADDPLSGYSPILVTVSNLAAGRLPIRILDPAPPPREYAVGTAEFRYWAAAAALSRGIDFWDRILPSGVTWRTGPQLPVALDISQNFGSAYLRQSGLEFYHESGAGRTIFTSESPDLVCHELGHAILDTIRHEIYGVAAYEQAAFHEAFGDVSALLCALQVPQVRTAVLAETDGRLNRDSRLSRIGESLGWLLNQRYGMSWSPHYLRNAANSFDYQPPSSRPRTGPYTVLTSEPHNFCRVFTGAFLEMLSGIVQVISSQPHERALQEATFIAAHLLVAAVRTAPVTTAYFSQVAAHLVGHAGSEATPSAIRERLVSVVSSAFVRRGILSVQSAGGVRHLASIANGHAAIETEELPLVPVNGNLLGLGHHQLFVRMPLEDHGQTDVRPTGINVEEAPPHDVEQAVYRFLEYLLSRGQLDIGELGDNVVGLAHPDIFKTHTLVAREQGICVERLAFNCGFDHP